MVNPSFKRDLALRHVLLAARIVGNQENFVKQLRAHGKSTREAEADLKAFRDTLRAYETDLALADKEYTAAILKHSS